jgi:hypothetical protein
MGISGIETDSARGTIARSGDQFQVVKRKHMVTIRTGQPALFRQAFPRFCLIKSQGKNPPEKNNNPNSDNDGMISQHATR